MLYVLVDYSEPACPDGWTKAEIGGTDYCYFKDLTTKTFEAAEQNCRDKDSVLSSINSREEEEFLIGKQQ